MAQVSNFAFGKDSYGSHVALNYGTIHNKLHLPPEYLETPPQPFSSIPFPRDPDFINRGELLDRVLGVCAEPAGRVALVGLGGVGKSQIAIESAYRIAEARRDAWLFWIYAGTRARVEEGFRTIADLVKLPGRNRPKAEVLLLVQNWLLNERNGRWTLVLDSADDQDVFYGQHNEQRPLATYLPQSGNGRIIITTRDKDLASKLTGSRKNAVEVEPMTPTDALTLLERKLGSLSQREEAAKLVQMLDCVPLAISQAAAYIQARAPRSSITKYLSKFQESEPKRTQLLKYDPKDIRRDGAASSAILATWHISFDYIKWKSSSAAELLSLMSLFDPQSIPEWALKASTRGNGTLENDNLACGQDMGSDGCPDNHTDAERQAGDQFEDDISMLRDFSLILMNEKGDEFEIHRLVQLSMKMWLRTSEKLQATQGRFIELLSTVFPTHEYENWGRCQQLLPHVQLATSYRPTEETILGWATLCHRGGVYAWSQGRYDVAEQMLEKAKKTRCRILGEEDIATLETKLCFAMVKGDQGQWEEAEELEVEVVEAHKTKLGADHPDTLESMDNLSATYQAQCRWEEAEELQIKVMEIRRLNLGADDPDMLQSMSNLASIYQDQLRWEEAEELQVKVLEARKLELEADHPDLLTSMTSLAHTYREQGRLEEAEELGVRAMETTKIKLGADHLDTLLSMASVASTYRGQGRVDEAEELDVEVMEGCKIKLGADHPETLLSMANLALTYWYQARYEEAKDLEVEVLETRKIKLGADHVDTLMSMHNLACTWRTIGRVNQAIELMNDCLQARSRVLGEQHPHTRLSQKFVDDWSQLGGS